MRTRSDIPISMVRSDFAAPLRTFPSTVQFKVYESYGNRYVLNGYSVTDDDMEDHVCVCTVGGKPTLIAIDASYREDSGYAPVEEPLPDAILGKYFKYDPETRSYKRSDKVIPTAFTCQDIREHLYTHGFDIDGIHYVRYKRSAGASRDGRCLFIAEQLYADMMAWSSCDLSADTASNQASWQAYIALTLSSIESTITKNFQMFKLDLEKS